MTSATVAAPWTYALQLPNDPRAPGVARRTLRAVLGSHGMRELADTAELLASELVTNAYRHAGLGPYGLRLRAVTADRVRVAVWDSHPYIPPPFCNRRPVPVPASDRAAPADSGRGLLLITHYADGWGAHTLGTAPFGAGKLLWVECGAVR
ncbi:ATP-binding protein [Streptomyces triticagri]|uniref:ATP-binding protein n=1 Tax=Streptomyces triticagri TaxID=2293568 RepID=A0A372LWW3_9ACTN|nr:ATP-binding protein [Streptomyces triticagri]RFU83029.1 ATP-binding protein [Streptomyces triticagri]